MSEDQRSAMESEVAEYRRAISMLADAVKVLAGASREPVTAMVMDRDRLNLHIRALQVLVDNSEEQDEAREALKPMIDMRKACGWNSCEYCGRAAGF